MQNEKDSSETSELTVIIELMSKFAIFATARSGSTSLAKVLGASKDVHMAIEPFHEKYSIWNLDERDYSSFIKDEKTMDIAIDEIFKKYTAIKILQYQFSEKLYYKLLGRKELRILFLRRRNVARGIVSELVAGQTAIWQKDDIRKIDSKIFNKLEPLSISTIRKKVDYTAEQLEKYKNFLKKNRQKEHLSLFYEELFSESMDENISIVKRICDFLEINLPGYSAIEKNMVPSEAQISYSGLYKKVPNYDEIVKEFGNL